MQQISNKKVITLISLLGILYANVAKAVCPMCVVAVGGGLGLSRWLGIDDAVSSIWIGALLVALIWWTLIELKKKNWRFPYDVVAWSLVYFILIFVPLYYAGILGHPLNTILGIDKIVFGTILGTIVFLLSYGLHLYLRQKNNGMSFFSYQKVVLPLVSLILISAILHLLLS